MRDCVSIIVVCISTFGCMRRDLTQIELSRQTVYDLATNRYGSRVVALVGRSVRMWNADKQLLWHTDLDGALVYVTFSGNDQAVLVGTRSYNNGSAVDQHIIELSPDNGTILRDSILPIKPLIIQLNLGGSHALIRSGMGMSVVPRDALETRNELSGARCVFSTNGKMVAIEQTECVVVAELPSERIIARAPIHSLGRVLDVDEKNVFRKEGQFISRIELPELTSKNRYAIEVLALRQTSDATFVAVRTDGSIVLCRSDTGAELSRLSVSNPGVRAIIAATKNGRNCFVGGGSVTSEVTNDGFLSVLSTDR